MFLESHVCLHNQIHVIISESVNTHEKAIAELKAQGGTCLSDQCQQNTLGSVIVNGKRSVWPLTKSEGGELDGRN
ncbi:hypothetical protein PWO55_09030 [Bacillus velezensis]|uniref:hypothetical protein n=1 Tax=Bacillus amyloliquefaciens group TaxID=1938374 RepID=UPI0016627DB6|nr:MULTISPECIES: hypothetical protein [Bacillus amyloliquefaciens group]UXZ16104.1 hypothetical protein KI431_09500 [Bacillus siamensis]MCQ9151138.1 hypothetical protein [Bacillus amyloliquefaciens]QSZ44871.1 hypothetical protein I3J23_19300 [Bacillus amyloliquefaciens]URN32561.1 hypothetical protein M8561_09630 [Bacillus velezensis]USK15143.1 hypothetical protein LIT36_09550 [Bacillus velezensis]